MSVLLRSRALLSLPAAALVVTAMAGPVAADPGGTPNGGKGDNRATTAQKPNPKPNPNKPAAKPKKAKKAKKAPGAGNGARPGNAGQAKSNHGKPPAHAGTRGPKPGTPRGGGEGAGAPSADAPAAPGNSGPATNRGSKLGKVVVCKWVRKPGVAEVPSHVIVVNANALEGKGFNGTFPFPFSDGQVNSMAIRWAEKGESAREISNAVCGAPPVALVDPPAGPGDPVLSVPANAPADPPGVLDLSETAPEGAPEPVTARTVASEDGVLPATGAQEHLRLLLVLGGIATLLGALLLMRGRLRRSTPGT